MTIETIRAGLHCDENELISLSRAGDMEALDRVCRCYGARLLAVARRKCRSESDARDAVQDTILAAGQHLREFQGAGKLEGWLVRTVSNACFQMRRGQKNNPHIHDADSKVSRALNMLNIQFSI